MLKLGIAGLGTVGIGVIEGIVANNQELKNRTGKDIAITAISARSNKERGVDLSAYKWYDCAVEMAKSEDIDVFVELIGGPTGTALESVKEALNNGKVVITANKAMLAEHGEELASIAENNNTTIYYEAAIAGGIPVLKTLREGMVGNKIHSIYGILNGTCNYIYTTIKETGRNFDDILKEAQNLGYAEAEPSMDVDGIDAAQKLALMASVAFGTKGAFSQMHIETIRNSINNIDVTIAEKLGYSAKLVGLAQNTDAGIRLHMAPALVSLNGAFGNVNGVLNGVVLNGDMVGALTLVGAGAGSDATASSVLSDIADVANGGMKPVFNQSVATLKSKPVLPMATRFGKYYIRTDLEQSAFKTMLDNSNIAYSHIGTEQNSSVVITDDVQENTIRDIVKDNVQSILRIEEC